MLGKLSLQILIDGIHIESHDLEEILSLEKYIHQSTVFLTYKSKRSSNTEANRRCVEGSGNRRLSGLENRGGNLRSFSRCIASRYFGVPPHQSDRYRAGRCYGQNLKVGGTVGTKQGIGHFGLVV